MIKIKIINGPNMNMLGVREPSIYGNKTYSDLINEISLKASELNVEVSFFQSNHEGAIVDEIQKSYYDGIDGIIINPAAYTHTSIAILDALKTVKIPAIEVHMSDISLREEYRQKSYVAEYCFDRIIGKGLKVYTEALEKMLERISR